MNANILTALAVVLLATVTISQTKQIYDLTKRIKALEIIRDAIFEEIRKEGQTEWRCDECTDQKDCPAANTRVIYPCPYFEKEEKE